jgi:phosphopantothenoylcysteine decarboxylase/phosphopantothenate--cysteine ligase
MGYALAQAALRRGAEVFLVSGPTALDAPAGAHLIRVRSASQMRDAVFELYPRADVVIKAAAVADYRPKSYSENKIKKGGEATAIQLVPTDDILALLGRRKEHQILVGFAAETGDLLANARGKLAAKNLDIIVANDVARGVFGQDSASAVILSALGDEIQVDGESKLHIADRVLDMVEKVRIARSASRGPGSGPSKT